MLIGACNPTLRPIHVFSQYLPLPVVGGYLAFIGIFCLEAGLSLMTGQQIDGVSTWGLLFKSWCGCHPQNLASSCSARANMSPWKGCWYAPRCTRCSRVVRCVCHLCPQPCSFIMIDSFPTGFGLSVYRCLAAGIRQRTTACERCSKAAHPT